MTDVLDRTALLARLTDRIEAFKTSDGWQDWLATAARFRTYSLNNQLLIAMQRPSASFVAGYHTWRSLGRQVKRGETGIRIFAPMIRKRAESEENDSPVRTLAGFKAVSVFDLAQTEGEPLPGLDLPVVTVPDETLFDRLCDAATSARIAVTVTLDVPAGVRGWWEVERRRIVIGQSATIASRTRTILHELAHAVDIPTVEASADRGTRAERELVAESAAFIIGTGVFGIDMESASSHYAASWGADPAHLHDLAHRVLEVANGLEHLLSDCLGKPV